jgi:heptaprenyl diphosphate synthase
MDLPGLAELRRRIDARLLGAVETEDLRLTEMTSHLVRAGGKRLRPILVALSSVAVGAGALPAVPGRGPSGDGVGRVGSDGARGAHRPGGAGGGAGVDPRTGVTAGVGGEDGGDGHGGGHGDLGRDGRDVEALLRSVHDDAVTGGVAVELAHVGSLHHDDVIDEARTRHNVDSVNARWGNLRAILSGDFLLARASELAASLGTEIATILAVTIGRLCAGEVRELHDAYQVDRREDDYYTAIAGKTAALYSSGCRIGGLVGRATPEQAQALGDYGQGFGMAFQIVDDVLDVVATDHELGKPAGHDIAEGVYNLPVLRALTGPTGHHLRALLGGPLDEASRARALGLVRESDGVPAALDVARSHVDRAVAALDALPAGPARDALASAAHDLVASVEHS